MIDKIHDNEIINYNVNFRRKQIIFETVNNQNQTTMIIFQDVLSHLFETESTNNIIFDIEEYEAEKMIEENRELLEKTKDYCWPIPYNNINELLEELKLGKYKYYIISSSCGLSGWVLAKEIQVK